MIRILLVDDHKVVRTGVKSVLSNFKSFEVCGEARDGQEALEKTLQLKPDLVLMDISMPKVNGLEATKLIRQMRPITKIIILSMHDSPQIANEAKLSGADAYLTKSSLSGQLESVITDI
jgi:DNA-binding NarL/FixJ family response regulator